MAMNIFRLCGDMSHQFAIVLLIVQLLKAKNARGISVKTQELRLLVFLTRYLDLFTTFYSLYNSCMKFAYIAETVAIIYMIKFWEPIQSFYNADQDSFPHWKYAVLPCSLVALATHLIGGGTRNFDLMELLWTFSIYLESIAILPQLLVLQKYGLVENLTGNFVFFLGFYRFMYVINWIYRAHTERGYQHHYVVYTCGIVQTLLYADFFYQYCRARCRPGRATGGDDNDDEEKAGNLVFEFVGTRNHGGGGGAVGYTAGTESLLTEHSDPSLVVPSPANNEDMSSSEENDGSVRQR
ncbi:lumen protein-retaining receptor [Seminavis robusta]|uniref:Lumen protein-retaining receptor n=1 Tax=Seminavis robusta TaxID=568900 RepID=A0A9N8DZQ3_9STRA|nr:lumen protein-retaining receptor [Seminavis robusta]|eukprot:Sro406_g136350.1 lumen protein-retaining receptor (296) ;mRNA; f:14045-15057